MYRPVYVFFNASFIVSSIFNQEYTGHQHRSDIAMESTGLGKLPW